MCISFSTFFNILAKFQSYSVHFSFLTFFTVSCHIPDPTVWVSHFPHFSVFSPYAKYYSVLLYFFFMFSRHIPSCRVCFSHFAHFSVFLAIFQVLPLSFSFSSFVSFLAIIQILQCAFLIFMFFTVSRHIPGPRVCFPHFP